MRRLEGFALVATRCGSLLLCTKRHARRRQPQRDVAGDDEFAESMPSSWKGLVCEEAAPSPGVSSLRSGGMMAAPATTSLDKIRAELAAMRQENRLSMEAAKQATEQRQWEAAKKEQAEQEAIRSGLRLSERSDDDTLTALVKKEFVRTNKPNDAFWVSKEAVEGVAQRSFLLQQRRFKDADEVLRKGGKSEATQRFVKLAFEASPTQTAQLVQLVQRMRARWAEEQSSLVGASAEGASQAPGDTNPEAVSRLAWLSVLEGLPDEDVRLLWAAEVLDADTLAPLLAEADSTVPAKADSREGKAGPTLEPPAELLLEEKLKYIEELHHLQEITNTIRETELGDVPSIDLAPAMVKAQRRQFEDVTAEELRRLEQYEEASALPTSSTAHPAAKTGIPGVSAALLDRVLVPSNSFLDAVAVRDEALRRSLEGMERIKREALLDPEFQEAVRFAHAVEEASVAPHLRGSSSALGGAGAEGAASSSGGDGAAARVARRVLSKREKRAARSREVRGPMARSPYSPEVVPYFYSDVRSIVPPRGAFNLPAPTPSKAERAALRGSRRRARRGTRYSQ